MAHYHFVTIWQIDAPLNQVWEALIHSEQWPSWWKAVEQVVELEPGQPNGIDNIRRYTWKTPLSYKLTFTTRTTCAEAPIRIEGIASGDVEGMGIWQLSPTEQGTAVRYTWQVETTQPWMNALAKLIRPLMEWNHHQVMQQGGEGLAQFLGTRFVGMEVVTAPIHPLPSH